MKILLTGASGYIGGNFLKKLYKIKNIQIYIITSDKIIFNPNLKDKIKVFNKKIENLDKKFFSQNNFDIVFHFAWKNYKEVLSFHHIDSELIIHYNFLSNLINSNCKKIFVSGSGFEYGNKEGKLSERYKIRPNTPYALSKFILFKLIKNKIKKNQTLIWGRIFNVYGRNHNIKSLFGQIDQAALNKKKFTMSLGNQKRDYIDIDDLSLKIYKLTIKCSKTGIYNIGSGKSQTLKNLVNQYIKHKKYKLQITYDSILTKKYEPNLIYANINKMNKIIDE